MTNPGAKYDAAANNQRMFEENKRLREELEEQTALAVELGDALPKAYLARDRLRGLLARLEWAGQYYHNVPACPACDVMKGHIPTVPGVHDPGCWLDAELRVDEAEGAKRIAELPDGNIQGTLERDPEPEDDSTFYLLVCRECGDGDDALVMPFSSARERGQWASAHTKGTGHDRWYVEDERRRR